MAFHTIWSVDLGKSSLKAARVRRERNSIEILAIDKVDYPVSENGVDSAAQAREALNVFHTRNEIRDPIVVSHPGQGTFSRFIKVPAFDQKKVQDMVRYEASQQIPFPLDEVIWDYHVIGREYLPGEEREIGLFAVRRETIDDYLLEFSQEGLSVEMLTIGYLGLLNFIQYDISPEEPAIVLDIGASHTDLVFIDGSRFWIRPLPHSGNDVSNAIMSRFRLTFPDAEKLKVETAKVPKQAEKIFRAVIQPKLQELVQEIQRSIVYYRSQADEVKFTKLYLLGNGSRVIGIKKFLEGRLGMPVERVQSIGRLRVSREVDVRLLQSELPAFGTALGLGIQAVGAGPCQVDLVPREEKIKKEISRKRKHVFFAAGVLFVMILMAHFVIQKKQGDVDAALQAYKNKSPAFLKHAKKVKALEKKTNLVLRDKALSLRRLGEANLGALEALRSVERVFAAMHGDAAPPQEIITLDAEDESKNEAKKKEVREAYAATLAQRVWLVALSVERTPFPEAEEGRSGRRSRKKKAGRETVDSYRVKALIMGQQRDDMTASSALVNKLWKAPLERDLVHAKWTKKADWRGLPLKQDIPYLWGRLAGPTPVAPGRGGVEGIGDTEQEGGPFFSTEVSWLMLPRFPEDKDKGSDDKPSKSGKKSGKSKKNKDE
jgi:type IV pilus assembly protein PilM